MGAGLKNTTWLQEFIVKMVGKEKSLELTEGLRLTAEKEMIEIMGDESAT